MQIDGTPYRTIWPGAKDQTVDIIDQTRLPHAFQVVSLSTVGQAAHAIKAMLVRGAPLIGATAAYGMALAMRADASSVGLAEAYDLLLSTRPTAVNLRWALEDMHRHLEPLPESERAEAAWARAAQICDEDVAINRSIGDHGLALIRKIAEGNGGRPVRLLTHCNAGWLATVDWGTATAPIYRAQQEGIPIEVWVDETRPRNQGASLTAWELWKAGVPHTLIVDNAGGHLMQHGLVDMCIVGTDRTTATGDVCNKIGTYLKALAAADNGVPFYVGLPSPTIDWVMTDGVAQIPIEEREAGEVLEISGRDTESGQVRKVRLAPEGTGAANYGFDVTPARLVTGLITERGVAPASREGLEALFPEKAVRHC